MLETWDILPLKNPRLPTPRFLPLTPTRKIWEFVPFVDRRRKYIIELQGPKSVRSALREAGFNLTLERSGRSCEIVSRTSYHTHRRPSRRLGSLASTVAPGKAATRWHSRRRPTSNNLGLSGPGKLFGIAHTSGGIFWAGQGEYSGRGRGSGWFTLKCDSATIPWVAHTGCSLPCVRTARIHHKKHDVSCHPEKSHDTLPAGQEADALGSGDILTSREDLVPCVHNLLTASPIR